MLVVTTGINYSSTSLGQPGRYYYASGTIKSGSGYRKAGALLALDSDGNYVPLNPSASDGTEIPRAILLEDADARTQNVPASVGFWGVYTRQQVHIPKHSQQAGDGTTTTFTVGEAIKEGTLVVFVDNVLQSENTDYTVNYDGGSITFSTAPASGATIDIYYGIDVTESVAAQCERNSLWLVMVVG